MVVQFSTIALGAQLVVMVADDVPSFDIARGCRLDSTQAFDLNTGQNETVNKCVADVRLPGQDNRETNSACFSSAPVFTQPGSFASF
jgi:hypothetical protein